MNPARGLPGGAAVPSRRERQISLFVYLLLLALHCAWVLSLPVFPSQDGPLHLYYVNIFRDLLLHPHGIYSATYFIGRYLPAYSLYYYGLIALGSVLPLQAADKIMVCIFFVVFAWGVRRLMQAVCGRVTWAPLVMLPVFINWPLMMGFVNYALATGLACFALAVWCRRQESESLPPRLRFLLLLAAVILSHPVPWMFAVAFIWVDLAVRAARQASRGERLLTRAFNLDLATAIVSCSGYLFLRSFRNLAGTAIQSAPPEGPFLQALSGRLEDYRHIYGLALFTDGSTPSHLHRLLFMPAVLLLAALAAATLVRACRTADGSTAITWSVFALGFLLIFPFIPANLNGSYFFAMRLMFLVYLCLAVAAAPALAGRRLAVPVGVAFSAFSLFTLVLAQRMIAPVAREIAALSKAPVVNTSRPGLVVWPEANTTGPLSFGPLLWAAAGYMRQNNAVLYNTTWLELAIIPVKVRPEALPALDGTFSIVPPRVDPKRRGLFESPELEAQTLSRVGYVVGAHSIDAPGHDVLTSASTPTAGWLCSRTGDWQVCTPHQAERK